MGTSVGIGMLGTGFIAEFHTQGLRYVPAAHLVSAYGRDHGFAGAVRDREGYQCGVSDRGEGQADDGERGHDDAAEPPRRECPADDLLHRRDSVDPHRGIERGDGAP